MSYMPVLYEMDTLFSLAYLWVPGAPELRRAFPHLLLRTSDALG